MVLSGELDEARARNAIGDIPPLLESGIAVAASMLLLVVSFSVLFVINRLTARGKSL